MDSANLEMGEIRGLSAQAQIFKVNNIFPVKTFLQRSNIKIWSEKSKQKKFKKKNVISKILELSTSYFIY